MLKTRKPTGKAPWPFFLIAGVEKAGKSWLAAELSASAGIGQTYWFEIGETSADQYGPVGDYLIVEHDGTFRNILALIEEAISEPADGKPNLIVIDSITAIWDLLVEEQQQLADKKNGHITIAQWGTAKTQWARLINALKRHKGVVIATARLDQVTEVEQQGGKAIPTGERIWKIRAEKNLPYEVDGIIELREHRTYTVRGLRSTAEWATRDITTGRDFKLANLLNAMVKEGNVGEPRNDVPVKPEPENYTPTLELGGSNE